MAYCNRVYHIKNLCKDIIGDSSYRIGDDIWLNKLIIQFVSVDTVSVTIGLCLHLRKRSALQYLFPFNNKLYTCTWRCIVLY